MALFPERETTRVPEGVQVIPEEMPEHVEKVEKGVSPRKASFTTKVIGNKGQNLVQSPQNTSVTITLPSQPETLTGWSKGSVLDSLTWFGTFWLRIVKKAAHFGWKIVVGRQN